MPKPQNNPADRCQHPHAIVVIRSQSEATYERTSNHGDRLHYLRRETHETGHVQVTCPDCGYDQTLSRSRLPKWLKPLYDARPDKC